MAGTREQGQPRPDPFLLLRGSQTFERRGQQCRGEGGQRFLSRGTLKLKADQGVLKCARQREWLEEAQRQDQG